MTSSGLESDFFQRNQLCSSDRRCKPATYPGIPIPDLIVNENAGHPTIQLTGITSGSPTEAQTLTITATPSDARVVPGSWPFYTNGSTTGALRLDIMPNATGTATVTVTVNDGQAQNNTVTRYLHCDCGRLKAAAQHAAHYFGHRKSKRHRRLCFTACHFHHR